MRLVSANTALANSSSLCRRIWNLLMSPLTPRNLRTTALLTSIYQLLISICLLFVLLLCLAHAEQTRRLLDLDILDQKESGFSKWEHVRNDLSLRKATVLAKITEEILYALSLGCSVYTLAGLLLLIGVYKNNSNMMLPWLVVEWVVAAGVAVFIYILKDTKLTLLFGSEWLFFVVCYTLLCTDIIKWYVMYSFFRSVLAMNKLREIATVAIPCPAPGSIPHQYRREHMYLGSNGYKHILTEAPDGQF